MPATQPQRLIYVEYFRMVTRRPGNVSFQSEPEMALQPWRIISTFLSPHRSSHRLYSVVSGLEIDWRLFWSEYVLKWCSVIPAWKSIQVVCGRRFSQMCSLLRSLATVAKMIWLVIVLWYVTLGKCFAFVSEVWNIKVSRRCEDCKHESIICNWQRAYRNVFSLY